MRARRQSSPVALKLYTAACGDTFAHWLGPVMRLCARNLGSRLCRAVSQVLLATPSSDTALCRDMYCSTGPRPTPARRNASKHHRIHVARSTSDVSGNEEMGHHYREMESKCLPSEVFHAEAFVVFFFGSSRSMYNISGTLPISGWPS